MRPVWRVALASVMVLVGARVVRAQEAIAPATEVVPESEAEPERQGEDVPETESQDGPRI